MTRPVFLTVGLSPIHYVLSGNSLTDHASAGNNFLDTCLLQRSSR